MMILQCLGAIGGEDFGETPLPPLVKIRGSAA
jgi:hypothetical protein